MKYQTFHLYHKLSANRPIKMSFSSTITTILQLTQRNLNAQYAISATRDLSIKRHCEVSWYHETTSTKTTELLVYSFLVSVTADS